MIIKPYFEFIASCSDCGFQCRCKIWNGVNDWDVGPSIADFTFHNEVCSVIKCTETFVPTALAHAFNNAPHSADHCVIWAENHAVYDLLVKLCQDGNYIATLGDEDDETDSRKH